MAVGGTLRSAPGHQFTGSGGCSLTDVALAEESRWVVNQGQETRLAGTNFVNDGTFQISHTGAYVDSCAADIRLDGPNSRFYRDTGTTNALAGLVVIREGGAFAITGGRNFTSAGPITNSGQVTIGAGSQFTATGVYTQLLGATQVDGILSAPGTVDIQHGWLSGSGRVNQNVHANGGVSPGASIDTLTIQGNYAQDAEGSLHVELGGTLPGESDLLLVTGQADLFDLTGRLVARLVDGELTAGTHEYRWDGRRTSARVGSGLLFARARLEDGDRVVNKTVRLLTVR